MFATLARKQSKSCFNSPVFHVTLILLVFPGSLQHRHTHWSPIRTPAAASTAAAAVVALAFAPPPLARHFLIPSNVLDLAKESRMSFLRRAQATAKQRFTALAHNARADDSDDQTEKNDNHEERIRVTALNRYAVKGLGPSSCTQVTFGESGDTFPDDRRFALLQKARQDKWNGTDPQWLHKENFLCAFTAPSLMARFDTEYSIRLAVAPDTTKTGAALALPWDEIVEDVNVGEEETIQQQWLTLRDGINKDKAVLGPIDLATEQGRQALGQYCSQVSHQEVICVTAKGEAASKQSQSSSSGGRHRHLHQFGNTQSGVRVKGDTRTLHIVNAATVRQFSERLGVALRPERFRPNIIVEGLKPWQEFDLIGQRLRLLNDDEQEEEEEALELEIISKTVRCDGVSVDPHDGFDTTRQEWNNILDIPKLLVKHFPEHGPYLGVYAVVAHKGSGTLSVGDSLQVALKKVDDDEDNNVS